MAIITRPLTHAEVSKAKPATKEFSLSDGNGLSLVVSPTGNKYWHFRYKRPYSNARNRISLGSYPSISIAQARELRATYLSMLASGIDPKVKETADKEEQKVLEASIFLNVAKEWFELKKETVTEDYALDVWRSLENDVIPAIQNIPISEISARKLIEILQPVKERGALETLRRIIQRINEIMIYAMNVGLLDANPASGIAKAFQKPLKKNLPTIRPELLPELMSSIRLSNLSLTTRYLIEWQMLTLIRPNEAVNARWENIDLEQAIWHIPAENMKGRTGQRRAHSVPLSPQAIKILERMKPISGAYSYVFPSRIHPGKPMNSQTANAALKRIGWGGKLVAHGLRSIASTAMNEAEWNPDVVEAALAHVDQNDVRRSYNRSTYLEQRKELMAWWGNKVQEAS
ncbi:MULTISPECIES: integrase domain-containing protein [unclassified Photorhabdus]|uniref:integrase domain-containing protein n=1 Tax=unclassified Photorhabdus TaxID=2620880 RepID=UPI000DCB86E6|nr:MULTISPECIES: integrase domain-containing protein [unclassified Photorhabdus]RAW71926.1 integrase [Photorhabdus sp. S7-51]RAW73521.1 integrase [Photorhabdus sp. S14-60]RAW78455.1 integrase [Photorhabdus sp. S15-56]HEN3291927.1 tyrosine-type recombinase/integrase [Yersinia enterocolitica]